MELCTRVWVRSAARSSAAAVVPQLGAPSSLARVAQMRKQKEAPRAKASVAAEAASQALLEARRPAMLLRETQRLDGPEQPEAPERLRLEREGLSRASSSQAQPSWGGLLQPAALPQASPGRVPLTGPLLAALLAGPQLLFSA
jgi:hypothetical protein